MLLAGVDLAWKSQVNPTGLAIGKIQGHTHTLTEIVHAVLPVDAIVTKLASLPSLQGIAIDAPLIIRNITGQRPCETLIAREYGARKAACHTSNLTRSPDADSVRLSTLLETHGFVHRGSLAAKWQLECYPHPALIEIFGLAERHAYKKGAVSKRKAGQIELAELLLLLIDSDVLRLQVPEQYRLHFDEQHIGSLAGAALKRNEDILDSVICVYVAGLYALDVADTVFGDVQRGYIYVPQRKCI